MRFPPASRRKGTDAPGSEPHSIFASAVQDRTATNPWAVGTSAVVNGGLAAFLLMMGLRAVNPPASPQAPPHPIDLSEFFPIMRKGKTASGGSGGGANELANPSVGRNPRFERNPLMPPQVPLLNDPKLAINPAP